MNSTSVSESDDNVRVRLKPKALLFWRVALVSLLGALVGLIFKIDILTALATTGLAFALGAAGCGFIFQSRKGFTGHDNLMTNLVGVGCILLGIGLLVWRWLL